jgi:hypothetical protein
VTIVRDSDGLEVATGAGADMEADGILAFELPAQVLLDRLTATWEVGEMTVITTEEIVGARLCTLEAVAAGVISSDGPDPDLVRAARDIAERFLEEECRVALRPRYGRAVLDGSGQPKLLLPAPMVFAVRAVRIDGALVEDECRLYPEAGVIWRRGGWPEGVLNVDIVYEHGYSVPPAAAGRCAQLLARHLVTKRPTNLDDRSTQISTDEATYSLVVPGLRGAATSLPEVNAFIESNYFPGVG